MVLCPLLGWWWLLGLWLLVRAVVQVQVFCMVLCLLLGLVVADGRCGSGPGLCLLLGWLSLVGALAGSGPGVLHRAASVLDRGA